MSDFNGSPEVQRYRNAKKLVEKKRAVLVFLTHLAAYVISNIFFGIWNALTYNVKGETTLWFYVPLIFWGVGVLVHYLQAIALFDDWWRTDESAVAEYLDVQEREG